MRGASVTSLDPKGFANPVTLCLHLLLPCPFPVQIHQMRNKSEICYAFGGFVRRAPLVQAKDARAERRAEQAILSFKNYPALFFLEGKGL